LFQEINLGFATAQPKAHHSGRGSLSCAIDAISLGCILMEMVKSDGFLAFPCEKNPGNRRKSLFGGDFGDFGDLLRCITYL
jgi:hypothetical protein